MRKKALSQKEMLFTFQKYVRYYCKKKIIMDPNDFLNVVIHITLAHIIAYQYIF